MKFPFCSRSRYRQELHAFIPQFGHVSVIWRKTLLAGIKPSLDRVVSYFRVGCCSERRILTGDYKIDHFAIMYLWNISPSND